MKSFGSDNHSGVHPRIMEAVAHANQGHAVAYGEDRHTMRVSQLMRDMFGEQADPYVVFSGTGANVLALRTVARPWHAVVCPRSAHINTNEVGAPDALGGFKLVAVDTPDGKLTPELVMPALGNLGNPHRNQPKVISITQPTEEGTLYTISEIEALARLAHDNAMYLHVDGARFGNAVAALGCTPRQMTTDAGVDMLCFGGTKNGMMGGEIVVFLNPELSPEAVFGRKQITQLASKMRFVSAQFEGYLKNDLWLEMAAHSNAMALRLAGELQRLGVELARKPETNGVFAMLPREAALKLRDTCHFNIEPGDPCRARWMCSWDTTEEDIEAFIDALAKVL